jgi:hypothetical protein
MYLTAKLAQHSFKAKSYIAQTLSGYVQTKVLVVSDVSAYGTD